MFEISQIQLYKDVICGKILYDNVEVNEIQIRPVEFVKKKIFKI